MNHRQWKKNYKKKYGYNPPTDKDARAAMKYLRKNIDSIIDVMQSVIKQLPGAIEKVKQKIREMSDEEFATFLNEKVEDAGAKAMALKIRMSGGDKD